VDEFIIRSSVDDTRIEFSERLPDNAALPIESYAVKITRIDLHAAARVWAGYTRSNPTEWFSELAERWSGWQGERKWQSLEGELRLAASHDRRGHISIRIELRCGPIDYDWTVAATVSVDAGQLDGVAMHAIIFFGEDGRYE